MGSARLRLTLGGALVAVLLGLAVPASATLPGRNGQIAVAVERGHCDEDVDDECGELNFEIVGIQPRAGRLTGLDLCLSERFCEDRGPNWSPDGRRLVFNRSDADGRTRLFVARPDGRDLRVVASGGVAGAWSPDGEWLVFASYAPDPVGLFVVGADGSALRQVTFRHSVGADWSSRDRVVFHQGRDIYSISSGGTGLRRLTRTRSNAMAESASWSPDGRRIAFVLHPRAGFDEQPEPLVLTMRADGRGKRRVVNGGLWPTWSPDGKRIAFVRGESVYMIRPDGTGLRHVRRIRGRIWSLAWQPHP